MTVTRYIPSLGRDIKVFIIKRYLFNLSVWRKVYIDTLFLYIHGSELAQLHSIILFGSVLHTVNKRERQYALNRGYRRSGFECVILLIANCEFSYETQSNEYYT